MKFKAKKLGILLVIGLVFPLISNNNSKFSNEQKMFLNDPKESGDYTESFIHIDGSISGNWSATTTEDWCYGQGTWEEPYIIENVTIDASSSPTGIGILIENSNVYFVIEQCTISNAGGAAIRLQNVVNGHLMENNLSHNNGGIKVHAGENNQIIDNIVTFNEQYGLDLTNGLGNNIFDNTISHNNGWGMFIYESNQTTITRNNVNANAQMGILVESDSDTTDNNIITNNTVNYNGWNGIYLEKCRYSTISGNILEDNDQSGITLIHSDYNEVLENEIHYNSVGIDLDSSNHNNISGNTASYNNNGIMLNENSDNCILYLNNIEGNLGDNGYDNGTSNQWDNGTIGNYWDGYSGKDANDDGIGDTPYTIPGRAESHDNYPIWWDSPIISIILPLVNGTFGKNAPEYNLSVEGVPHTMWYEIEGISGNLSIAELTGTIDQDAWNNLTEGDITMTFYVQDSRGEIDSESIVVSKSIPAGIPGYNLFFLLGIISVVAIIITKKIKKS